MHRRRTLILAIALLYACLSAWDLLSHLGRPLIPRQPDPVSENDRRLAPLRLALQGAPRAGFLPLPQEEETGGMMRYYLAQFALAPTILIPGRDEPLVVVDPPGTALPTLLIRP